MAAIDKFYITNWTMYSELFDWLNSFGEITDDFGNKFKPVDYIAHYTKDYVENILSEQIDEQKKLYESGEYKSYLEEGYITEEEFNNFIPGKHIWGIPVMNTSHWFDVWLIRNCPVEWVQDELKNKYGNGYSKTCFTSYNEPDMYDKIKNRTSVYDKYQRNGVGNRLKINKDKILVIPGWLRKGKGFRYFIHVRFPDDEHAWYHENDSWYIDQELKKCSGYSSSALHVKYLSPKALFRKIKKWNLPENSVIKISVTSNRYIYCDYELIVKRNNRRK